MVLAIEIYFYNTDQLRSEREKARYKYEVLKNQVNPHFLFNCLNVLSSLAYSDAEKANLFAKRLSGVYRYILDTRETDKVTTDVEMAFVRACPPCHPDKHPDAGGERPQAQHQHRVIPAEDTDRNQR